MSLLVIALSGADGGVAQHLMDEGRMPHLLALVEGGASASINWLRGGSAVAAWLTVATGQLPAVHGVDANPVCRTDGFGVTLAERAHLRATPIWERIAAGGTAVQALGWPASHGTPVDEGRPGLVVAADTFFYVEGRDATNWPAFPESVSPRPMTQALSAARVHPAQLHEPVWRERLGPYGAAVVRAHGQKGLAELARLESVLAVAQRLETGMARFVFLDILERLGLPRSQPELAAILAAYGLLDSALGRLVALAGGAVDVVVMARPPTPALMAGSAPQGMAVFRTPGHEADSLLPALEPLALAAGLADMADATPYPEQREDGADEHLLACLADRYPLRCRPLKRDRMAMRAVRERGLAGGE